MEFVDLVRVIALAVTATVTLIAGRAALALRWLEREATRVPEA